MRWVRSSVHQRHERREFIALAVRPVKQPKFHAEVQTLGKTLNIWAMLNANTLLHATTAIGRDMLRPPKAVARALNVTDRLARCTMARMTSTQPFASMESLMVEPGDPNVVGELDNTPPASPQRVNRYAQVVPMRSLGPAHRSRIEQHLLALEGHDRYLRFGFSASDEQVSRYVEGLNFDRDEIYGIYNRKLELVATAHLAFADDPKCLSCAEFGVSVLPSVRGRGFGSRLFERALIHARNEGIGMLFIHALSENAPMLAIARKHGATMARYGSETEAHLDLPPADFESRVEEYFDDKVADIDFELKLQAKHFWDFLAAVQDIRRQLPRES